MFILNHVSFADKGTSYGALGPYHTLAGAQKAADEYEEGWRETTDGQFIADWDEVDGDDWGRRLWFRDLVYRGAVVGALEIYEFTEMGD